MKKLLLLTIILVTTFLSFSQTVTKTDSTLFPTKYLKPITKELLSYDGLKLVVIEKDKVIDLQKGQIGLYVQKDSLKDQKIFNLNTIIDKTTQQRDLAIDMSKSLEKELKVQQMKTKFYKAGSILGIGIAIITTSLYLVK